MTTDDSGGPAPSIRTYRPPLFRNHRATPPTSAHEALVMTAVGLREPNRWCKYVMWSRSRYEDRPFDPEGDPFAGPWQCCASGMLWLITIGVEWHPTYGEWLTAPSRSHRSGLRLYRAAGDAIKRTMIADARYANFSGLEEFNDGLDTDHHDVLTLIDRAVIATTPSNAEEEETRTE